MLSINNDIIPGADLPNKGKILLTSSPAFTVHKYFQLTILFKNPNSTDLSSLGFMSDDILYNSLKVLIRDHYAPFTGWIELVDTDVYLVWDNYKNDMYSPRFPVHFETDTIDTSYDQFYRMVQDSDPFLKHTRALSHHSERIGSGPLFFIKVVHLKSVNQAVAISFTVSHMVMDGCSFIKFYENWGSLYRQMQGGSAIQSISDYEIPHPPLFGTPDFSEIRTVNDDNDIEQAENKANKVEDSNESIFIPKSEGVIEYHLNISKNKQKEIRNKAHESSISFSTYLFSILWKESVEMQFRQAPEIIDNMSVINIAVDIRQRLGIPENFCSSFVIGCYVSIKVADILKMNAIDIAKVVKKRLSSATTPENICRDINNSISLWKKTIQEDDSPFEKFTMKYFNRFFGMPMVVASSIMNFNFYGIDFGVGRPVYVRIPKIPIAGAIFILPPNPSMSENDVQVLMMLPKEYNIKDSFVLGELVSSN